MDAGERYREVWQAREEQTRRLRPGAYNDAYWSRRAGVFTLDPHRPLDQDHRAIAELIRPEDVVVDVGGGAGRISLPLASRCAELINVEPAEGMCAAFERTASEAGITNARAVQAGWMEDHGVTGDVTLLFNVTYFVADIVPFIEKLVAATRRRVIIGVWSVPPPDRVAPLHEILFGERLAPIPGHRELLPVLWELGILPDVRVLPNDFQGSGKTAPTREAMVQAWVQTLEVEDEARAARLLDQHFDDLFRLDETGGVAATFLRPARELLITWEV